MLECPKSSPKEGHNPYMWTPLRCLKVWLPAPGPPLGLSLLPYLALLCLSLLQSDSYWKCERFLLTFSSSGSTLSTSRQALSASLDAPGTWQHGPVSNDSSGTAPCVLQCLAATRRCRPVNASLLVDASAQFLDATLVLNQPSPPGFS